MDCRAKHVAFERTPKTKSSILGAVLTVLLSLVFYQTGLAHQNTQHQNPQHPSVEKQRPNILICIADDWSFGHAGAYGCQWVKTPAFDEIARRGVLFRRAYTPNAKCAPSRASLITGRNSWQLKAACNHTCFFPPEYKSFMEALDENGYRTGHTTKGWGPGIAVDVNGKKRKMTGQAFNELKLANPLPKGIHRVDYAANFEKFLESAPDPNQPWCFWYGALEPHRGYEFQVGSRLAGKKPEWIDRVPAFWPDNDTIRHDMLDYAYEVEHFDHHVGRILKHLEATNQLRNTIIVVTSDHGMPFPRCKGQAYEMSNHVPLAIMWSQGIPHAGRVVDDFVSLIDIAPTLIETANLDWMGAGMSPSPGRSLVPLLRSSKNGQIDPTRDHVVVGKERHDVGRPDDQGYPIRGIVQDNFLYLKNYHPERWPAGDPVAGYLNCDGSPTKTEILNLRRSQGSSTHWDLCFGLRPEVELYDISSDPDCVNNLAQQPGQTEVLDRLRRRLNRVLLEQQDPRMSHADPDILEKYPYANAYHRDLFNKMAAGKRVNAGWVNPSDYEPENPKVQSQKK